MNERGKQGMPERVHHLMASHPDVAFSAQALAELFGCPQTERGVGRFWKILSRMEADGRATRVAPAEYRHAVPPVRPPEFPRARVLVVTAYFRAEMKRRRHLNNLARRREPSPQSYAGRALGALKAREGETMSFDELRRLLGNPRTGTLSSALSRLCARGEVEKPSRGEYRIARRAAA